VGLTVLDTFLLLLLQRYGIRKMEAFIIALVAIVGTSFLVELLLAKPPMDEVVTGFVPSLPDDTALYIAIGIIGATVMPHNLYLHSALVQTRKIKKTDEGIRHALKINFLDTTIALNLAFFVNAAILILAATVFYKAGHTEIADLHEAHRMLEPLLGTRLAPILFAVALIAAGQSSTVTGTLAGQIVMEGYLRLRINPWLRRLLTRLVAIIPALIVIWVSGEEKIGQLLVFSQVLLSLQLGFAVIPLIHFVSDKHTMGAFAIKPLVKTAAWLISSILVYLNIKMVWSQADEFMSGGTHPWANVLIILIGAGFLLLLVITVIYPWLTRYRMERSARMHPTKVTLGSLEAPAYKRIAMALDFSQHDEKIIANALAQGRPDTEYVLIHIVESASARYFGKEADDFETRKDQEQLDTYLALLAGRNIKAKGVLGYRHRAKEIVRIVKAEQADLLILGGHGHTGIKDWIYGETVNYVRHYVHIPVLVVQ
jgi:manganese transport protein